MKDEDGPEVFRGHLDECLRHLDRSLALKMPKGSRGAAQARKPLANFCGVNIQTATKWLYYSGPLPIGEQLIKLLCYLDAMGYKVIELERTPSVLRNFAELIGFELLSANQASELLGYSCTSALYDVLQGHKGVSDDKTQKMWGVWKERKEELEKRKTEARKLYRLDALPSARLPSSNLKAEEVRPAVAAERTIFASHRAAAVNITEGLLALLEEGPLDGLPESELANLHQVVANTILRLSARLTALSSRLAAPGYDPLKETAGGKQKKPPERHAPNPAHKIMCGMKGRAEPGRFVKPSDETQR